MNSSLPKKISDTLKEYIKMRAERNQSGKITRTVTLGGSSEWRRGEEEKGVLCQRNWEVGGGWGQWIGEDEKIALVIHMGSTVGGNWGLEGSLEGSNEEGMWKSSFFLMANNTHILSSSKLPSILQEVYIQQCNYELIMLNKKIKNMYRLVSEGLLGKFYLFHIFEKRIP